MLRGELRGSMKTLLIHSPVLGYLDGFTGSEYEWTDKPFAAWAHDEREAQRRIAHLSEKNVPAVIVERRQAIREHRQTTKGQTP
jgi:hypothetical protein